MHIALKLLAVAAGGALLAGCMEGHRSYAYERPPMTYGGPAPGYYGPPPQRTVYDRTQVREVAIPNPAAGMPGAYRCTIGGQTGYCVPRH